MSDQIRLRRHTDGRVVVLTDSEIDYRWITTHGSRAWLTNAEVVGEGWSELFVAELPEPDRWIDCVGDDDKDAITPQWEIAGGLVVTAWIDGIETNDDGLEEDLDRIRFGALKMLAAVAACEKYRAERKEAT